MNHLVFQPAPDCAPDSRRRFFQTQQKFGALDDLARDEIAANPAGIQVRMLFAVGIPIDDGWWKLLKVCAGHFFSFRHQLAQDCHPIRAPV